MTITTKQEKTIYYVTATFAKEEVTEARAKALEELAKEVTVEGYEKGKAPLEEAKKQINDNDFTEKAVNLLIPNAYKEVVQKYQALDIIMQPSVKVDKVDNEEVVVTFVLTTRPEVKLGTYRNLTVKKDSVSVTDEEVAGELEKILESKSDLEETTRDTVQVGDTISFDFEGYVDGEKFEGGTSSDFELEVGSHKFIPGFEEQLVGKKVNVEDSLTVKFPENYVDGLSGKEATFKILVHGIYDKKSPKLDEEFVKSLELENVSTPEELRAYINSGLLKNKEYHAEAKAFRELVNKICEKSNVEIPSTLLNEDTKNALERFKQDIEKQGIGFDKYLEITGMSLDQVKENIILDSIEGLTTMFVLSKIALVEKITVDANDIYNEYQNVAKEYGIDIENVKKALEPRKQEIINKLYNDKVTAFLKSVNNIE